MRRAGASVAAAIAALLATPLAAAVDAGIVANPRAVQLADRGLDLRWRALFEPAPRRPLRLVDHLARNAGAQAGSLLSARLLYRGPAWTRRETDTVPPSQWRRTNTAVQAAILRELRWHDDRALIDVHRAFLVAAEDPVLIGSALVNLLRLDEAAARDAALRLTDPARDGALPAAQLAAVRRHAVDFLVGTWGLADADAVAALRGAFRRGAGERLAAIALLPRGDGQALLEEVVAQLLAQARTRPLAGEDRAGLALALNRLRGVRDRALAGEVFALVVHADRVLAMASASALADGVPADAALPAETAAGRANGVADPALRHALLGLVLRLKPAAVRAAAGPDSPWSMLAAHRERLADWEWAGMGR